mmetsp:Transcript_43187/g.102483  ORF Transcript_43187/g.102483 Transcript_43187/m.102483 type:complete len:260 (+) Transcript_43187:96-875(+)
MGREAALLRGSKTKERNWEGGKGNGERRSRIPSPKQGPQSPSVHLPIATALSIPRIPAILPSGMHLSRPFQLPGNSPMGHLNRREKLVAVLGVGSTTSAFFSAGDRGHGSKGAMASGWQSQSGNRSSGRRLATRLDSRRDSLCSSHPLICVSFPLPARWVRPSDPTRPSPLVLRRDYLGALLAYLGDFYNRTQPLGGKDRELKKVARGMHPHLRAHACPLESLLDPLPPPLRGSGCLSVGRRVVPVGAPWPPRLRSTSR